MDTDGKLRLLLPTGRIQESVLRLLARCGLELGMTARSYRPVCSDEGVEAKILKPQNIPQLVALGRHDCGFTGHDWVVEQGAEVLELLDLGCDEASVVAAVPEGTGMDDLLRNGSVVVASEYPRITRAYVESCGFDRSVLVQTYGATEALPPDDADMIVDNTSTGTTLAMNRLRIVDRILETSTRFVCNREAYETSDRLRDSLDRMTVLLRSSLDALDRRILEMNVPSDRLDDVVAILPCMRSPTVAPLYAEEGFAVKIAMPRRDVPGLIPILMRMGARDILEYSVERIVT